jgi:CRISPR-associated protein Csm5
MSDPVIKMACTIDILSPLHIGSGERLGWMSMVAEGNRLHVIDEKKLLAEIAKDPRASARLVDLADDPHARIEQYLRNVRISPSQIAAYSIPIAGALPSREVFSHIKRPGRHPMPYIPGSSLKGAVRTALIQAALLEDKRFLATAERAVERQIRDKVRARHTDDRMEKAFFGRDQHHDWMRALQFADTEGVDAGAMAVVEVQTLSVHRGYLNPKRYSNHPEALMPGRRHLRGSITINVYLITPGPAQHALNVKLANRSVTGFVQKCNRVSAELIQRELAFYARYGADDLCAWYKDLEAQRSSLGGGECMLWLGWGSGYESQATANFFDRPLQETLRLEYDLGRIVHRECGDPVSRSRRPQGQRRWYCRKCKDSRVHDDQVELVWPFAKSRKVAMVDAGRQPMGWIKLRI